MNKKELIKHLKEQEDVWEMINGMLRKVLKVRKLHRHACSLDEYEVRDKDIIFCSYEDSCYGEYETNSITFPINYLFD